jgi:WD40 repeat protein
MVLYKDGTAGYLDSLGRYRPVYLDSLGYFPPDKDVKLPVLDTSRITSIAPVYYNVIGYKMLSALDNNRLVEWNLNGSLRRSPTSKGIYKPVIYYMKNIHLKDSVVSIAITKDRTKIFTASDKGIGIIWQADTSNVVLDTFNYEVFNLKQDTIISSAFSNSGLMIITSSVDNSVKIWNTANGDFIKELKGHTGPVTSLAFSANDRIVYTGSLDQTYKQWQLPATDSISKMSTMQWNKLDNAFMKKITDTEPCDSLINKTANKIPEENK